MADPTYYVHPAAEVPPDATVGAGTRIWRQAQVREHAYIGENCNIGKGVYIDAHVHIGSKVKIQNHASIFEGVTLEDGVFIGPHVCFTNDMFPRAITPDGKLKCADDWEITPTLVKYGASIGAGSVILCGITIGEFALIGAGSVVTRDVPPHSLVFGNPARHHSYVCRCARRLSNIQEREGNLLGWCETCRQECYILKQPEQTSLPKLEDHEEENYDQASADPSPPAVSSQQGRPPLFSTEWRSQIVQSIKGALIKDWHSNKYALFGAVLALLTTLIVVAYYLNHPQPELYPDTSTYISGARQIQTQGQFVNAHRVPGFPLLIVFVFALAGQDNMMAVGLANAALFILATLEIYLLAVLIFRRAWVAFCIGLLVGTNMMLLSFVKPIVSESLALWLLVSLTLAAVLFVYTLRWRYLWLVTGFTLALFLTRPEWVYVPVPLFAYLLLVAVRHRIARRFLDHMLVSVLLLCALLGSYIYINAVQNHFVGVTDTQNINIWGKVIKYNMQDEAPPQYAAVRLTVDTYLARGVNDPRYILDHEPSLERNHYALAGAYAQAIIDEHPAEFLAKSVPVTLASLTYSYYASQVAPAGAFGTPLVWLQSLSLGLYGWNQFFPICAALWLFLLFWPRTAHLRMVQAMGVVVLLALYGLILTTLGGFEEYTRLHTPFNPLLIFVVWGSLIAGALLVVRYGPGLIRRLVSYYFRSEQISTSTCNILVTLISGTGVLLFMVGFMFTHGISSQVGLTFSLVVSVVSAIRYFGPGIQKRITTYSRN